ncbi:hypothetical protein HMPREF2863_01055 [Micrococcus sp. HMSC067E09]|uniref:lyase family protein n=1 Tax=Micrococcus sp. HMSC067E09 TaxID=1739367 RepID=UPI0008A55BFD|nr:lyase family protein [Micrococcus sp. HMSC067E09]OFR88193.1 hypothetical protein HMPREF2863_01055 [Micrococcus sp. HMSC067E09]
MTDHPSSSSSSVPPRPAADHGLLDPALPASAVTAQTSDAAVVAGLLEVEAAWTQTLAEAGVVSADEARAVRAAADRLAGSVDLDELARAATAGGNALIPLLKRLRAELPAGFTAVHVGATSQDIVDTMLMRMAVQAAGTVVADLRAAATALAALAVEHRSTPMVARSLAQHSLPITFGLRAANWLDGLARAADRLAAAAAALPIQWGGAAGTLAALDGALASARADGRLPDDGSGPDAFGLTSALASRLGLQDPPGPWDTTRLPVTQVAAALADAVAACGRIANDVLLSSRVEIGELAEPTAPGRGGSSAMPHKQNPVLSVLVHSLALSAPGTLAQVYTAAGAANEDRPDGAWHAEWPALRRLLRDAGAAAALTREVTEGLRVRPERMRANLDRTGPVLVSERLMSALAPRIDEDRGEPGAGRAAIQAAVDAHLAGTGDFRAALRQAAPAAVSDAELDRLCDPGGYVGLAEQLVDRILAAHGLDGAAEKADD